MTMAADLDQKGQALIELVIFLPLMFALYSMISGFASAINGSINQQKVTRAYFYYRIQNNSTIPKPDADGTHMNWRLFGMYFVGWRSKFEGDQPVMPCYQVTIPMAPQKNDRCDDKYSSDTTQHIRVGTVYGICGATYAQHPSGNSVFPIPDADGADFSQLVDAGSCLIR